MNEKSVMRLEAVSLFVCSCLQASVNLIQAVIASGFHLFPFRTEKLSPSAPMVLHTRGRVGRRRLFRKGSPSVRLDWRVSSFIIRLYSTCILLSLFPRMLDAGNCGKGRELVG